MIERKSPNPACPSCGRFTKTRGERGYSQWSDRKPRYFVTECTFYNCSLSGGESRLQGVGQTMKEARSNYIAESAKRQGGAE